jgi:hypothetical protein
VVKSVVDGVSGKETGRRAVLEFLDTDSHFITRFLYPFSLLVSRIVYYRFAKYFGSGVIISTAFVQ